MRYLKKLQIFSPEEPGENVFPGSTVALNEPGLLQVELKRRLKHAVFVEALL